MRAYRRFILATVLLLLVLLLGTVGYRLIVGGTWLEDFYMVIITVSTVGYGEVVPGLEDSPAGRIFTIALIMAGMGTLLYVVSATTAFFIEGQFTDILRRRRMDRSIAKLEQHLIVCGAGNTGIHVIDELTSVGESFVVIENDRETLERALKRHPFLYVSGDPTDSATLLLAGVERARGVVTVLPDDKDNIFVTLTVRRFNARARVVARAADLAVQEQFRQAGADAIVAPEQIGALRIASELLRPAVVGFLDQMLRQPDLTWRFEQVAIGAGSAAVGRTLAELRIAERAGVPVLAIIDEAGTVEYYPGPGTVLRVKSQLVVLAERAQVGRLRQLVESGA